MNEPELVFVLGAPRSGTSWLQRALASQPNCATAPELQYFAEFAGPTLDAWDRRVASMSRVLGELSRLGSLSDRVIGLPASAEFDELVDALRLPIERLVQRGQEDNPQLSLFVEKTPTNSIWVSEISRVFPEAHFVHLVRDPRDVVRSLRDVSSGWGKDWAPHSVLMGALYWRTHVLGSEEAKFAGKSFTLLRYEDIRDNLADAMGTIYSAVGLSVGTFIDPVRIEQETLILSRQVNEALAAKPLTEPIGFGDGRTTRPTLTALQQWTIELVCCDLMGTYGYELRFRSVRCFEPLVASMLRLLQSAITVRNRRWRSKTIGIKRLV
jgi:hypothetical protein